jgi:hypothetical protein
MCKKISSLVLIPNKYEILIFLAAIKSNSPEKSKDFE